MSHYTKADLRARINAGIKNKIGLLTDSDQTINDAVRAVNSEMDLRSARRMVTIQPGIFDDVLAYPAPVDIKAKRLVSLSEQKNGNEVYYGFNLIPYEQFNAKLGFYNRDFTDDTQVRFGNQRELYTVAFDELNEVKRMLISAPQSGTQQTITTLDSLTAGGGLWTAFGDAFNVDADLGNYVQGQGSIKFDINGAAGLTAGIYNATMTAFDISSFFATNDSFFTFAYLSNVTGVNSYTLRIGTNATNYYQITITATHSNTAFAVGWNTLRFDATNFVTVGTPDPTACQYVALFMNKEATKINQSTFRFDSLVARTGTVLNVRYYSKFPWKTVNGVYIEESTEDDDVLVCDGDEYNFIVDRGIMVAGEEVDELAAVTSATNRYDKKTTMYMMQNPSEALVETSDYQAQYYI